MLFDRRIKSFIKLFKWVQIFNFALNIIPILYICIISFINHINVERKVYFLLLYSIFGEILNIIFKEINYLTFIYSASLVFLYIYTHDMIINKDSLTGANNRRYLDSYVYLNDRKYAVYMIDIDDFKKQTIHTAMIKET